MAEKEERSSSIPWLPLISLILVGSGVVLSFQQLTSSRPGGGDIRLARDTFEPETIDARLWEDPLGVTAADRDGNRNGSEAHAIHRFQRVLIDKCFAAIPIYSSKKHLSFAEQEKQVQMLSGQIKILAVMLPGGPYVEDVERRLRGRRAVIEGLAAADYEPEKDHEIGYFCVPWQKLNPTVGGCISTLETDRDKDETGWFSNDVGIHPMRNYNRSEGQESDQHLLVVPCEWYEQARFGSQEGPCHVLVLWLNDAAFRDAPLARLADLISWFRFKLVNYLRFAYFPPFPVFAPVFTVLGPDNSGTLREMVMEANEDRWANETRRCLATTHIYSYQASAADSRLLYGLPGSGKSPICKNLIEEKVNAGSGFCFERMNLLDDQVVETLWHELGRRGLKKDDHVAIISEEDTYYARALCSSFMDPVVSKLPPKNIQRYTYLRGIDGKLPSKKNDGKEANDVPEGAADKNTRFSLRPRERTEGLSQSDDIRRLAEKLQKSDIHFKAVGLLGSDVYDKLELLKALRPMLPEAVFFTNNLDARLAHPDEWSETHNLVVVSARGLSLDNDQDVPSTESDQKFPPFRDSAQTALFEATLEAMGGHPAIPKSPLIFEIGRNGAEQLGLPEDRIKLFASFQNYLLHFGCFIAFGCLLLAWVWLVSRVSLVPSNEETRA